MLLEDAEAVIPDQRDRLEGGQLRQIVAVLIGLFSEKEYQIWNGRFVEIQVAQQHPVE